MTIKGLFMICIKIYIWILFEVFCEGYIVFRFVFFIALFIFASNHLFHDWIHATSIFTKVWLY